MITRFSQGSEWYYAALCDLYEFLETLETEVHTDVNADSLSASK